MYKKFEICIHFHHNLRIDLIIHYRYIYKNLGPRYTFSQNQVYQKLNQYSYIPITYFLPHYQLKEQYLPPHHDSQRDLV